METALVTGARGFVGAWLAKALLERGERWSRSTAGAAASGRRRSGCSGSSGARPGRGRAHRRRAGRGRARPSTRSTPSSISPPRRSSAPSPRRRCRGFETNVRGTWTVLEACREARRRAGRRRLLRQGLRRARRAALPRGLRAAADGAVRGVEGRRRPDRAQLLARLRPAGRGDPVREHLRRRRPQLLAPRPGGGLRGDRRPAAGPALRRLARARLPLRRGRGRRLPRDRRRARPRRRSAARRSTPAAAGRVAVRRGGRDDRPARRHRGRAGGARRPATRRARSTASSSTRLEARERCGWEPPVELEEGLERTIEWYRDHPEALAQRR